MPGQRNRPTMDKKQEGLSKRLLKKIDSGTMGRFMHASQYRGAKPDVGRNDDCPCGSGKKYKFCCGR